MEITIEIGSVDPPEGRTCRQGAGEWLPFAGWLDLISAIERLMESARRPLPALETSRLDGQTP